MSGEKVYFPDNHKYALIVLQTGVVDRTLKPGLDLGGPFVATRHLPIPLPDHWKGWLGELRTNDIERADLFLAAVAPAKEPAVLNMENEDLLELVHRLYYGVVVSSPGFGHREGLSATGSIQNGTADVRRAGVYPEVVRVAGNAKWPITATHLREAAQMADSLTQLRTGGAFDRTWRVIRAFYRGLKEHDIGDRLHQFVRCVEGFILPEKGSTRDQFKERSALFIGPGHGELLGLLFDIRSSVEHLHGPLGVVPYSDHRKSHEFLVRYCLLAEAMARHCLRTVLMRQTLWEWFRTDEKVKEFWETLTSEERCALWGPGLDVRGVSASFREEVFRRIYDQRYSRAR